MRASDIMTTAVITVGLNTSVANIARTLVENRISAVPVVDEHEALVGIVSEADLIRLDGSDFLTSHSVKAVDIMIKPVIAANPEMGLDEVVSLFHKNRINRAPVVADGKIVGIVTRADILRAVAHNAVADAA